MSYLVKFCCSRVLLPLYYSCIQSLSVSLSLSVSQGHFSFITHLDWSVDSQYLVSNSGDYEILYCKYCLVY